MSTVYEEHPDGFALVIHDVQADGEATVIATIEARRREYPYGRESDCVYAEITTLWVHRDHRRRGIASRIVAEALRWAGQYGYTHVSVEATAKADRPGPQLYRALGFEPRSTIYDIDVCVPDNTSKSQ